MAGEVGGRRGRPVAVPEFDGVTSLRAVVVRADPDQPSMRPVDPLSPE